MAAALPYSRSLAQQLWYRSTRPFTRPGHSNSLLRVSCPCSGHNYSQISHNSYSDLLSRSKQARTYATAAAKTTRKPRATSGRTRAAAKTTTTKRSAKKPAAKKTVKKPKKKAAAKKPKPKKIRVKKVPSKTALAQKARLARADLRKAALLDQPKRLPATAYTLLLVAEAKSSKGAIPAAATNTSAKYKALSAEEREVRIPHHAQELLFLTLSPSVSITKQTRMQKRMHLPTRNGFNPTPLWRSKRRTTLADSLPQRQKLLDRKPTTVPFKMIAL